MITRTQATRILTDLIAIPSVNPMGRPRKESAPVERRVIGYIEGLFAEHTGVELTRQRCSEHHESLLVRLPGRDSDAAPALFESHVDTVPADDWPEQAFIPRVVGDSVFGRGACDDKGPLTSMLLALLDLLANGETPPQSVLLMAAGDEEYAQTGIRHFRRSAALVGRAVFGEPTNLCPIVQHKGTVRWDITVHGTSAHTSQPELGSNAILGAMETIDRLGRHQEALQARYTSPLTTGPLLTVTMINGGRTRNAVPDECTLAVDFRLVPGMDPGDAREEVIQFLAGSGWSIGHSEVQLQAPALNTSPEDPFCRRVLAACRQHAGAHIVMRGAPYGTDAGWIADLAPAIVLGPGDIACAHAVDEQVNIHDVLTCARIYREIMSADFSGL